MLGLLAAAVTSVGGVEVAVSRRRRTGVIGAKERLSSELA
jgi:hypothetical protein